MNEARSLARRRRLNIPTIVANEERVQKWRIPVILEAGMGWVNDENPEYLLPR
jgi:hypothetical protein